MIDDGDAAKNTVPTDEEFAAQLCQQAYADSMAPLGFLCPDKVMFWAKKLFAQARAAGREGGASCPR